MDKQTHQKFMDNTMLMGRPSVQEERDFKRCLTIFAKDLGLKVNPEKSQIFFFNTPGVTQRNIIRILGFSMGSLPSKYIGPHLDENIRKV